MPQNYVSLWSQDLDILNKVVSHFNLNFNLLFLKMLLQVTYIRKAPHVASINTQLRKSVYVSKKCFGVDLINSCWKIITNLPISLHRARSHKKQVKEVKGPYADHILIPQGATVSSTFLVSNESPYFSHYNPKISASNSL